MVRKWIIIQAMNPPKCAEYDYINFLIANPRNYSCTEAARIQPKGENNRDEIRKTPPFYS